MILPRTHSTIGIGVAGGQFGAVLIQGTHPSARIADAWVLDRAEDKPEPSEEEVHRLACVLARRGLHDRPIHLAVPRALLMPGVVEAPPRRSEAPREQIARAQLARMFHVEPATFELALWELPETPNRDAPSNLLACGCSHETGQRLAHRFEQAGLFLASLVPGELAAASLLTEPTGPAIRAVVNVGHLSTHITLTSGRGFLYERMLDGVGGAEPMHALMDHIGVTPAVARRLLTRVDADRQPAVARASHSIAETLASEVAAAFDFAEHRWHGLTPGSAVVTGPFARIPGLAEFIAARTAVQTEVCDLTTHLTCSPRARRALLRGGLESAVAAGAGALADPMEAAA